MQHHVVLHHVIPPSPPDSAPRELGVAACDLPALVTLAPLASRTEEVTTHHHHPPPPPFTSPPQATMAEILVEKLGVPALYLANKAVMALYGGGQMTGVAVDSGQDTTYIVPTLQGSPIQVTAYQPYRTNKKRKNIWV